MNYGEIFEDSNKEIMLHDIMIDTVKQIVEDYNNKTVVLKWLVSNIYFLNFRKPSVNKCTPISAIFITNCNAVPAFVCENY